MKMINKLPSDNFAVVRFLKLIARHQIFRSGDVNDPDQFLIRNTSRDHKFWKILSTNYVHICSKHRLSE